MLFNLIGISAIHAEISSLHIRKSLCKDIFLLLIWQILITYSLINANLKASFQHFFPRKKYNFGIEIGMVCMLLVRGTTRPAQIECLLILIVL